MPEKETIRRAKAGKRQGKAATAKAGKFARAGKNGARPPKQIIAIGLSKARRSGVNLPPPRKRRVLAKSRASAKIAYAAGRSGKTARPAARRSAARLKALQRESRSAASTKALSRQARTAAKKRSPANRSGAGRKVLVTRTQSRRK